MKKQEKGKKLTRNSTSNKDFIISVSKRDNESVDIQRAVVISFLFFFQP